ncbi:hypothetical protein V491_00409 [Pseudogymnoascus sp. VKM F-3775]|nr:hypothetical protein V491_00409 [Pseudogymnoascus sp. VKM F-3775]
MLASQSTVDTPMRKYILRLIHTAEALTAYTARKKGKRVALNKVIFMSTEEIHLTVTKLERETRKNKEKKRTRRARHEDTELEIEDDLPSLTVTKLERETRKNKEKKRTRRARHEDTELLPDPTAGTLASKRSMREADRISPTRQQRAPAARVWKNSD